MDNRISDKDLEFVNGGFNNSEEAISGAIGWLQRAVEECARLEFLSIDYEPQISGLIQRLQSCNGDFAVINEVVDELSHIRGVINDCRNDLLDYAERRICGNVCSFLTRAINQLA